MRRSPAAALAVAACAACGFPGYGLGHETTTSSVCDPAFTTCSDGCVDLQTYIADCGKCGNACGTQHGGGECAAGQCRFPCDPGWMHCGPADSTGCDTDTTDDAANCGACKHDCLGGACKTGVCQPTWLAMHEAKPTGIAVEAEHVYWLDDGVTDGAGTLQRAALDGSARQDLVVRRQHPIRLALVGTNLYWTEQGSYAANFTDGVVARVPTDGGCAQPPCMPTVLASSQAHPLGIVVAEPQLFFTRFADGLVVRLNTDGTGPLVLAAGQALPEDVTVAGSLVYWTDAGTSGAGYVDGSVQRVAATGGAVGVVAAGQALANGITTDGTGVYWVDTLGGTVWATSVASGQSTRLVGGLVQPSSIAVSAGTLYVGADGTGQGMGTASLLAVGIDGHCGGATCPVVLATGLAAIGSIAVDATAVYFTDPVEGNVMRLAR
jgi:sugar lactone lactonase YvrE